MTTKENKQSGRRRFLGRMSAIAAGIGALASSFVPELRAQTRPPAANPAAPAIAPAPPLTPATENALYAAALGNADVALLLATLPQPGRLDPPRTSHDVTGEGGYRAQTVLLPVTSYATGSVVAYVCYGSCSMPASEGPNLTMILRALITNTGAVSVAGGGYVAPSTNREWNDAMFYAAFPEEYFYARLANEEPGAPTGMPRTSGSIWNPRFLRRARYADNSARGACLRKCARDFAQCTIVAWAGLSTAIIMGIICFVCISAATGGIFATGGVAVGTVAACRVGCGIAAGGITTILAACAICSAIAQGCIADCKLIPPERTI